MARTHARLARTIVSRGEESAERHQKHTYIATVQGLDPYRLELHGRSEILTQNIDLQVSQFVHFYHHAFGIKKGDGAIVHFIGGIYWFADVLSDTACSPADATIPWTG